MNDIDVGYQIVQECCIDTKVRRPRKFPSEFVTKPEIFELAKKPKPRFPSGWLTSDFVLIGSSHRLANQGP